jgi:hypothetical protein
MAKVVGLIGENKSDTDVLGAIIRKASPSRRFKFKTFHGHGKGKIVGKCNQWAKNLRDRECTALILAQDLDDDSLTEVKNKLKDALEPSPIANYCVVIPVRMIEAWILSDTEAIKNALNLPSVPNDIPSPELLPDPKSRLAEVIYISSQRRRRYMLTKDNGSIAAHLRLECLRSCPSFRPLEDFIINRL